MNKKIVLVGILLFGLIAAIFVWAASDRSPSCCINVDGYCMDINYWDGVMHTGECGPYNTWISDDFCENIDECQPASCKIDGAEMPREMNFYQCSILCDKLQEEGLCSSCVWNSESCT